MRRILLIHALLACVLIALAAPSLESQGGYTSCGTDCYLANTPGRDDLDAAITAALASNGGEVRLPAGSATYTSRLLKTITKNLTIRGAGTDATTGTVITHNMTTTFPASIQLKADGDVALVVRDIRFVAASRATDGMLNIYGSSSSVVLRNLYFYVPQIAQFGRAFLWGGHDSPSGGGVMTECTFDYRAEGGQGMSFHGSDDGFSGIWPGTPTWGTTTGVKYVENSSFVFSNGNADGAFDAYSAARLVFRHNNVSGTSIGWHGADSSASAHSAEIYQNAFTGDPGNTGFIGQIRGGTAVIWGNRAGSDYNTSIVLALYRACTSTALGIPIPNHLCDGTSPYDGNAGGTLYGYPCYHQPGTSGVSGIVSFPVIEWDNIVGGGATANTEFAQNINYISGSTNCLALDPAPAWGGQETYIVEGRDFINHDTCVGVTSDFCAAWWDDVNKKAKNYTPFTYPHPLVATLTDKPSAPTAVRIR